MTEAIFYSEHGSPGTRLRVWEAPAALLPEGAT